MKIKNENQSFKDFLDQVSSDSISAFIDEKYLNNEINSQSLSYVLSVIKNKKYVHYLTWSRKDEKFFYTNYRKEINRLRNF